MITDQLLIIFIKNPVKGKVKTRLAKTMGDDKAFEIYKKMLVHTFSITKNIGCDKIVYYSDCIEPGDAWHQAGYSHALQSGIELGERMHNAFTAAFHHAYKEVVLIGSDCLALTEAHLLDGFKQLHSSKAVIGPATDGGFYLLGLRKSAPDLFLNKIWSHKGVLDEMKGALKNHEIVPFMLPELSDIDEEQDWINYNK